MSLLKENENVVLFKVKDEMTVEEVLFNYNISSRLFRKLKRDKAIFLNGKPVKNTSIASVGDIISIVMGDEIDDTIPEPIPLDIVYEDYDLLIFNKKPNMVVHPTKSHQSGTVSNGISYYYKQKNIKKKIRFVNRLDMDTSGVLIVAKNSFSHQQLAIQFQENSVTKKYIAIVDGLVENDNDIIDLPIGREEDKSVKKVVTDDGKRAITEYNVKERYKNATLLEVQIYTGRSHQIRVHLNHIGHPIIGDVLYNKPSEYIGRQALHANYIKFKHPRTQEDMEFIAPLPEDMTKLISILKDPKN
ncbi:RluA family pseudouridine synthase [Anaerosalibacter sp. Marseille-P3206]|uniref:RluA family pseudouridine synthase n=1 Tax=Anaerosalibacter sp. Marseille-P3206 TaxID=1871005 RepID=UPI0009851767|nr:RluA family pseudouridine synthase [Anaerosalibacter sp. Marseille-P3206]